MSLTFPPLVAVVTEGFASAQKMPIEPPVPAVPAVPVIVISPPPEVTVLSADSKYTPWFRPPEPVPPVPSIVTVLVAPAALIDPPR